MDPDGQLNAITRWLTEKSAVAVRQSKPVTYALPDKDSELKHRVIGRDFVVWVNWNLSAHRLGALPACTERWLEWARFDRVVNTRDISHGDRIVRNNETGLALPDEIIPCSVKSRSGPEVKGLNNQPEQPIHTVPITKRTTR